MRYLFSACRLPMSLLALGLFAANARADFRVRFAANNPSANVALTSPALGGSGTYNGSAGRFLFDQGTAVGPSGPADLALLGTSFFAFCADLAQPVALGQSYTYQVGSAAELPQVQLRTGNPALAVARLEELWGRYYSQAGTSNTNAAAFQLAIWEIVHDSAAIPPSLSTGTTTATGVTATTANGWLSSLTGDRSSFAGMRLVSLVSANDQDLITAVAAPVTVSTPAPAGLTVGLFGSAFGLLVRRLRRSA